MEILLVSAPELRTQKQCQRRVRE